VVRPLPRRPIKLAGSKYGTVANSSCVSPSGALHEAPVVRLDLAPIAPEGSVSGAMACFCRNVRKMITKRSGKCIVSYKSKWNEWQPTCTFNSSWVLLHIGALRIAAGDSNGCAISVSRSDVFFCLQGYIVMNNGWYLMFDRYKKDILRRKGRLVMLVSRHCRDLTWITR